ncbi:MAG TPA: O-antigen polymerase [Candidatus Limnocylindrales bacterium]|nr:O-antigen polymerase [Candidatus Limnocylindrales bacterium]
MERTVAVSPPRLHPLDQRLVGIPDGLLRAYRDAFAGRRLAWASPAIFTVGAYLGFYGLGLVLARPTPNLSTIAVAVGLGLVGLLAGIGLGWGTASRPTRIRPVDRRLMTRYGLLLFGVGSAALIAYFAAIGYVPLFQASLEQSRVDAATEGGATLRVISLLALPGAWILIAQAVAGRDRRGLVLAAGGVVILALGFALTGNRSPAFLVVEVAIISGLLAAGKDRLGGRSLALLALVGVLFVVGAGAFGAFRLGSQSSFYGPLVPGERIPPPNYPALTAISIKGYVVVPIQNLDYTLDAVPDRIGWQLGGTYLQPLLTVLPGRQTTFDADLKAALDQHYAGGGTVPGLLGEAYANFGPVGWLVIPFLAGAALTVIYRVSQGGGPELIVLYAYALIHVSIGGVLSGLSMASVFPFEAYAVLGFAILALPVVVSLLHRRPPEASA